MGGCWDGLGVEVVGLSMKFLGLTAGLGSLCISWICSDDLVFMY
jgi:hypothetical protein